MIKKHILLTASFISSGNSFFLPVVLPNIEKFSTLCAFCVAGVMDVVFAINNNDYGQLGKWFLVALATVMVLINIIGYFVPSPIIMSILCLLLSGLGFTYPILFGINLFAPPNYNILYVFRYSTIMSLANFLYVLFNFPHPALCWIGLLPYVSSVLGCVIGISAIFSHFESFLYFCFAILKWSGFKHQSFGG